MDSKATVRVGQRVCLKDKKDVEGVVSFFGFPDFAPGKWVGLTLDTPKGKNNGTVQGRSYFTCPENYGMFVRQTNIMILGPSENTSPSSMSSSVTLKSRLPVLGATKSGSVGSRSPSFTDLKGKKTPKPSVVNTSRIEREPSFIEPNFVQTMKPPSTSESPSMNSPRSDRLEEKVAALQTQQNLQVAREEVKDLNEKLETLKIKRVKDQEKIKELDKMKIQHETLTEFKSRIMESQKDLQRKLVEAERIAREAVEAKERHADEMSELSETMEMATLDKEMAEEKAETLQIELEHAKERIEELTLDLDIIKTEFGTDGSNNVSSSSGITNFEFKQLTAQNEKLRETLVRMRDLSAHEKNEITKYTKEMEEMRSEMATLLKENEKSKSSNEEMRQTIVDLQDQVDAALGSEEMVDNLTVKCLDLEDKVSALIEEKEDLETLHDMNEELQENARETEIELREELDLVQAKIRDIKKEREAAYEIINDHETTIRKFRDLVGKVQEQNTELRGALERETNKPVDSGSGAFVAAEMMDFKKMFAETKAHSKAIDMELRQCEADQSNKHVMYLTSFMSDSFMGKGGDNEAVLVLLLIPRLIWKVRILSSQVKDKFCPSSQPTIDRDSILKGHTVERYSFGLKMTSLLHTFTVHLGKFESALNTCSPATFLRIGTLFPEMSVHEKAVDFYINLLRKDQLDENVPTDNLNKSLNYFENIYPLYLSEEKVTDGNYLLAISKAYSNASEALSAQISIGKALLAKGQDDSQIGVFFKTMEGEINETVKVIKSMKRRIPEDSLTSIVFPGSYGIKFDKVLKKLACLVNAYFQFGKTASVEAGSSDPENGISPVKLLEILSNSVSSEESLDEDITGDALSVLKKVFDFCSKSIQELNKPFQDGEWDVNSNSEPRNKFIPPVELRSQIYKTQLKEAESIKYKLENKDLDIKELKKHLKVKGDELSEMQVRKDLADKKLFDSSRDSELMIEKLQRKLDDVCCLLRRKEKEFEDTMDQLQSDIESLESEKGELKDRVKNMSKKPLLKVFQKVKLSQHQKWMIMVPIQWDHLYHLLLRIHQCCFNKLKICDQLS
ncbi:dynactin subunit 1 [Lepeophtheirus salmonis]|uniref:dynactin subunit 1 n=1 Tax=Lepeophtheirus salmonis TaxID=72036 RepID=UPI001AE4DD3D|nr:dynactin subunit 1-like [Lepeophtheirus salmonis]